MRIFRPLRPEPLVALACGGVTVLLVGEPGWALPVGAFVTLGVLPYRRFPLVTALAMAAVSILGIWLGIPTDEPWNLAGMFVGLYALGRYGSRVGGGIALAAYLPLFASAGEPIIGNLLFGAFVFGAVWTFGFLVRRRADDAARAAATATALAAEDPAARVAQAVAEERARLAGDALAVVRSAVVEIQAHAAQARADLDPGPLEAVQREGRRATRELRRLLGLLRSEPAVVADEATADEPARSRWRMLVVPAAVAALLVLDLLDPRGVDAFGAVLAVLLAATVLLRRVNPAFGCLLATMPPAVALGTDTTVPYGLWAGVTAALLAWAITSRESSRLLDHVALTVFLAVYLLDVRVHDPANLPMTFAIVLVPTISGILWLRRGREHGAAVAFADALQAEHDAATERAVRAERLRLAHELHDVTSHSVGVMVLQAGAAAALWGTAREDALAALDNVHSAGVQALCELDVLFGLLDSGAVGAAGHAAAGSPDRDLRGDLEALTARMDHAGLNVTLDVAPALAITPRAAFTVYRVVQEALTNAVRYAPGADVEVLVRDDAGALEVLVRDSGARQKPRTSGGGTGFGLVGLEERIRELGGDLSAGPRPTGGFEVRGRLPLQRGTDRQLEVQH
jgi:signal transduction histidine kinase